MVSSPSLSESSSSSETTKVPDEMKTSLPSRQPNWRILLGRFSPLHLLGALLQALYYVYQYIVDALFSPPYVPLPEGVKPFGRVAIVGGGLTGIATAAHFKSHGFEVVVYEEAESIGGIWARVNSTSSLQLNSLMYRFHPSVLWSRGYPHRDEIVGQIEKVAKKYDLEKNVRLNTKVTKVSRHGELSTDPKKGGHGRWCINDGEDGVFDAVVATVGTCGRPKIASIHGSDTFRGQILHSSQLDDADLEGKKIVVIGSGASGVEASELAVEKKAKGVVFLARHDKWIIPRNTLFDIMLALQPFGREMPLSFIPEWIIRIFHYRDLKDLSPKKLGLFEGTPIVNNEFLTHIRQGYVTYKRADTLEITPQGVKINERTRESAPGDEGTINIESADVIVLATGFEKPSIEMLPEDLFPVQGDRSYERPNLYLQNFSTEDWSVLLTNASYMNAIGSVGNWHIGLYARILMVFILDKKARPEPKAMKLWVDFLNWLKVASFGGKQSALAFFTYLELVLWIITFHFFRPSRIPWIFFVMFGWGVHPLKQVKKQTTQKKEE